MLSNGLVMVLHENYTFYILKIHLTVIRKKSAGWYVATMATLLSYNYVVFNALR